MESLHENKNTRPNANEDVDFGALDGPRSTVPVRIFAELDEYRPYAELVGVDVEAVRVQIGEQRKYTFPRVFREATECRYYRLETDGERLYFYPLE